jgi:hypothetical protein
MKIVMTLLVRDEADILGAQLAFHLSAGVDFVIAIDHASVDGTTEILESYVSAGYLRLLRETGAMREIEWRTHLARLASDEHGADWVISSDADQFWWPRGGSLKEALAAVPMRFGAIHGFDRVFVPRPEDDAHFAERMIFRMSATASINAPASTYRPLIRVVHRGDSRVIVARGSHSISGAPLVPLPNWHPIEVLHFPWRSSAQMARKARHLVKAFEGGPRLPTAYHSEVLRAVAEETPQEHFARLAVDDDSLRQGVAGGSIVVDTRLRDVLRSLAGDRHRRAGAEALTAPALPAQQPPFARPTAAEDSIYAVEAAVLREANIVRTGRHLDRVERRVSSLEARSTLGRVRRRMRARLTNRRIGDLP